MNTITFHQNAHNLLKHFGGEHSNNLSNLLFHNEEENEWHTGTSSPYVNLRQFISYASSNREKLSILSLNCQSLNAKFDRILSTLETVYKESHFYFKIICLQETWHKHPEDIDMFTIPNYHNPFHIPASCSQHGGLVCYVHQTLEAEQIKSYSGLSWFEGMTIRVSGDN